MIILNFREIGNFRPTIGLFNFFAFWGDCCSGIPLPRLVIYPPLISSRNLPRKIADFARRVTRPRGAFLNFRPRKPIALLLII